MTRLIPIYPPPVQRALDEMRDAGEQAWLVGGAARDLLLGRPVKDYDIVIAGDGMAWAKRLAGRLNAAFVPLDEARRVGRIVIQQQGHALWLDVAQFRYPVGGLEADLRGRDFTVNAIAVDETGEIVDPTGGVADLEARQLRLASPDSLTDDPLRLLRAVRLSATHDLAIPDRTLAAMRVAAPGLSRVAMERIREEWFGLLAPVGAASRVALLGEIGALDTILPELVACRGIAQSPPHTYDVYGHILRVLEELEPLLGWIAGDEAPPEVGWVAPLEPFRERLRGHLDESLGHELPRALLLKQAALLHDIGKPVTRSVGADGRIHFYGHEKAGAGLAAALMRRLRLPNRAVEVLERIVRTHMRPLFLSSAQLPSARAIYRYFRDARLEGVEVTLLALADQRGKALATDRSEVLATAAILLDAFFESHTRFVTVRPLLDGREIMALTGREGEAIGQTLEFLREQQAMGTVRTPEQAAQVVRGWNPPQPKP